MKIVIKTDSKPESQTSVLLKLLWQELQIPYRLYDASLLHIDDRYFITVHTDTTDRDKLHKDLTAYLNMSANNISMTN